MNSRELPSCRKRIATLTRILFFSAVTLFAVGPLLLAIPDHNTRHLPRLLGCFAWAVAQWTPSISFLGTIRHKLQNKGWSSLEQGQDSLNYIPPLEIPVINFTDPWLGDPLIYLEATYGNDWRERPLLLKGLWNESVLNDSHRRLSLKGLQKETLTVPYFRDARVYGALSPDGEAPIHEIIRGIIEEGRPYKIGSQLFLQANPPLLSEVAPLEIVTELFGDRFTKDRLLGHIQSPLNFLRGPLTVPMFLSSGSAAKDEDTSATCDASSSLSSSSETASMPLEVDSNSRSLNETSLQPFTGLHCEPIGNVAMNLAGTREWTLVEPQYSHLLRPAVSPDGRGFFASWAPSIQHVPRYEAIRTLPGDAVWVPTWTWHQVKYVADERANSPIAMGASLFHFRPLDFFRRNPLYAIVLLPYLVGEFVGIKSQ